MKLLLITLWSTIPLALAAYHFGPGQDRMKNDGVAVQLEEARQAGDSGDHEAAIAALDEALAALPAGAIAESRQIRLARAKEKLPVGQLPAAHDELESLFTELNADPAADPAQKRETRTALASAKYYLTWLMRLEGASEEQWKPEIEAARQHFRLLAEESLSGGVPVMAGQQRENLESAIRLARMDLAELQGLPLPKQCKSCSSGKCAKPQPAKKDPPKDSRAAGKTMGIDESGS